MPRLQLLIGTNNAAKIAEFRELLRDCGWQVVTPGELGLQIEVEETGTSYLENARIKAAAFSHASGLAALADDSGLEVDALDGAPGALHHVNGWDGRNNDERIQILLDALKAVPDAPRTARYRVVIAVSLPSGELLTGEATSEGLIVDQPAGKNGFGYDPVFYVPARGKTMAEMSMGEKGELSHRGLAAARIVAKLRDLANPSR